MTLRELDHLNSAAVRTISVPPSISPAVGIFADIPIVTSAFSLHTELLYSWNKFSGSGRAGLQTAEMYVRLASLQAPVLVRYITPMSGWRWFADAGPSFTYNVINSNDIYLRSYPGNVLTIGRQEQVRFLNDFMVGYVAGIGLQRQLNYRKTLSFELRYTKSGGSRETSVLSGMDLFVGFSF